MPRRLGLVTLLAVLLGAAPAGQTTPALPAAKDLIAKHIAAIGGLKAYKAISSYRARGRFEIAPTLSGDFEIIQARPNRMVQRIDVTGMGHAESGYDGKIGWTINPQTGAELLTGRQLAELVDDAWFDGTLHEPDHVREMTTIEKAEFGGRPAYKVRVVFVSGHEEMEYYDAELGWAIGGEARRDTQMGVLPTTSWLKDYKKFGALMFPTLIVQRVLSAEQTLKVATFEYDVVQPKEFDLPPVVKALIKRPLAPSPSLLLSSRVLQEPDFLPRGGQF